MNRAVQLAPILYALTGSGVALCVGMLFHNEPPYRVMLEDSVPALVLGAGVGMGVGIKVKEACERRPGRVRAVGLVTVVVLYVAIAAPLGWVVGSIAAYERIPRADLVQDVTHLPPLGMAAGAVVGCVIGLSVGAAQVWLDRRRSPTDP